jgi:acetyltransferase, GNAT family
MSAYRTTNILDLIYAIGEDEVTQILSDFSCPKNPEIENFVKKNAINFAKQKISVTHLAFNDEGELMAVFTLAHKALELNDENMSESNRKRIRRYARLNEISNSYTVSAFLIAQFGKNYANGREAQSDGNTLMESAMKTLVAVQREVGGGIVYLECEDKPQLLAFYQNSHNAFHPFDERYSESDQTKYIQLLRFF